MICGYKGHFDTETLEQAARERGAAVSQATIYRTLPLLERAGIIRRASVFGRAANEGVQYEHVWGAVHHDHLVCSRCGMVVEFTYPAIEVLQEAVAAEHGFRLHRHHLELVGLCGQCQEEPVGP